ncbi:MAG: ABC transporter ATP-binding protein [Chloroflexota bacterium]|nr:MAG: ABC transporter ATP-binding protein [Chloroflexota bacterium]
MNQVPALQIKNVDKSFADQRVLLGITLDIPAGEIVALLGPSGCGKSTLLSIIAGIERQDRGEILWMGNSLDDIPPHQRKFGLMFQDNVLFPHLDVFENVAFGLKMSAMDTGLIQEKVAEALRLVGLAGLEKRNVNSLSGGEQQRVALARSLAPRPRLLMLDEPLGALDRALRERLLDDLHAILHDISQTVIYVTHDQEEAFAIADRIILMKEGKIEQIGRPEDIYRRPETLFTARFLGMTNLIPGNAIVEEGDYIAATPVGKIPISKPLQGPVTILIRPDSARLDGHAGLMLEGKLVEKTFRGNLCQVKVSIRETELTFIFLSNLEIAEVGEKILLSINPEQGIIAYTGTLDPSSAGIE